MPAEGGGRARRARVSDGEVEVPSRFGMLTSAARRRLRHFPPAAFRLLGALICLCAFLLVLVPPRPDPAHFVMFTNREASALVVIRSTVANAGGQPVVFHVVVEAASCCPEIVLLSTRLSASLKLHVYTLGELTLELLEDGLSPLWASNASAPDSAAPFWVRPGVWDADAKHRTPLNHARFYIADFRFTRGLGRLLFVDDDIVVQSDVRPALRAPLQPGRALLVSCNAITFDKQCGYFHLSWNRVAYRETSYFSWRPWGVEGAASQNSSQCADGADVECIAPGGFERLAAAAAEINGEALDWSHFAWNYGFVVLDLRAWRRLRLTRRYERWMAANAEQRFFVDTSIGFGLGIPFLVLHGAVQCLDPARLRIVEGLGVMNGDDMALNGVGPAQVAAAGVLHYTGELKPWLPDALPEFSQPYRRYDASAGWSAAAAPPRRLFVLLGGEHAGQEWLMSLLDQHPQLCASGEGKGALHTLRSFGRDALAPPSAALAASDLDSDWVHKCSRQALCSWRHFARAVTYAEGDARVEAYGQARVLGAWRRWWAEPGGGGGNATRLFEHFLRAFVGRGGAGQLTLPCACPEQTRVAGLKFMADWIQPAAPGAPWASPYEQAGVAGSARALDAFKALNATLIVWERASPVDAFLSLQKSVASGEWHCLTDNCVPAERTLRLNVSDCRGYVSWYRASLRALDEALEAKRIRHVRLVYEECLADQPRCLARLLELLGVDATLQLPQTPARDPARMAYIFEDYEKSRAACENAN